MVIGGDTLNRAEMTCVHSGPFGVSVRLVFFALHVLASELVPGRRGAAEEARSVNCSSDGAFGEGSSLSGLDG